MHGSHFTERSCAESSVYLSSVPSQAKLVQLSCVRQSLHSEPEVCNVYACYLSSLCMYAYAGWCTALLVLACSLFSTISSQGLLDWGLLEHRTSPMVRNSNDKAMHKECLHYAYFSQCTKPVVICDWRKRQQRLPCRQLWMRCALSQTTLKGER